jgi:rfaE bifunctional protein nucleotidyltransferase chain/domain
MKNALSIEPPFSVRMSQNHKIFSLNELPRVLEPHREANRKVVHCHGVFDLLHIGHIRYFEQVRSFGDVLVVTLTPDVYVDKGDKRPAFTEQLRAEAIASLSVIDYVAVNQWPTAEETLRKIRPHIYVKGSDFKSVDGDRTGKLAHEERVCRELGIDLRFTQDIVFSSTNLINWFFSSFSKELHDYLDLFRRRYSLDRVLEVVDAMARLKVLLVGDVIIDEYCYCSPLGASGKSPVLAAAYRMGLPFTIHVGIGYDILHEHPNCGGAAVGAASYTDFLIFAKVLENLARGVVMNFGSAIMAPEVFLKAMAMIRNVAARTGRKPGEFTTLVCDLHDLPADYRREAAKSSPSYYFRPWKTLLVRTVADGGASYYVKGHHADTIAQLWTAIGDGQAR